MRNTEYGTQPDQTQASSQLITYFTECISVCTYLPAYPPLQVSKTLSHAFFLFRSWHTIYMTSPTNCHAWVTRVYYGVCRQESRNGNFGIRVGMNLETGNPRDVMVACRTCLFLLAKWPKCFWSSQLIITQLETYIAGRPAIPNLGGGELSCRMPPVDVLVWRLVSFCTRWHIGKREAVTTNP